MPYVVYDGTGGGSNLIAGVLRVVAMAFLWGTTGLIVIGLVSRSLGIETIYSAILPGREFLDRGWETIPDIFRMWQHFLAGITLVPLAILAAFMIAFLGLVAVVPSRVVWLIGLVPPLAFWLMVGVGFPLSELPNFDTDGVTLLAGVVIFTLAGLGTVTMLKTWFLPAR